MKDITYPILVNFDQNKTIGFVTIDNHNGKLNFKFDTYITRRDFFRIFGTVAYSCNEFIPQGSNLNDDLIISGQIHHWSFGPVSSEDI